MTELLALFGPVEGDRLASVGDMVNKGPDSAGALDVARQVGMRCVRGNHEAKLFKVAHTPSSQWSPKSRAMAESLGPRLREIAEEVWSWPLWLDLGNVLVVHAGLQPGVARLEDMDPSVLMAVRTWDGEGKDMDNPNHPAWFDLVRWPVPVVFGHWALKGLVDRPDVKGLDSGCVYGRELTGWCPEEDRFYRVRARREYVPMSKD